MSISNKRVSNKWIIHVKKYALDNDISYKESLVKSRYSYNKTSGGGIIGNVKNKLTVVKANIYAAGVSLYDKNKANSLKIDAHAIAEQNKKLNNCVYKCGKNNTTHKCIQMCNNNIQLKPGIIRQTPDEIDFYKREALIKKYQANF